MPNAKGRWRRSAGPSTRCEGGQADPRHRPRGAGLSGPGRGGAGRAGGGRSRSKMAAQRRSLLQSVSGIFPPLRAHAPPRWVRGSPRPPPHPPPALPCGKGEVPPPWGGGSLLCRPLCRLRAGGPGLRGSLRGQRCSRRTARPLRSARRATGGWGAVAVLRAAGCPAVAGGSCLCRPSRRWRPRGCL